MEKLAHVSQCKIDEAVLYALRYYSLFKYPLTVEEIYSNCSFPCREQEILHSVEQLTDLGKVFHYRGFFSTEIDIAGLVERRLQANFLAGIKIPRAVTIGKIIAKFPFVEFVGISGSLSKGYADSKTDYDFFIVTANQRLWVCRTILHLFKKATFLFSQEHKFCMNYFLDVAQLKLEEQNIYTAIELSTLIPVAGSDTYEWLQDANLCWVKKFLPNPYKPFYATKAVGNSDSIVRKGCERIINPFGSSLNSLLMRLTDKRWRRKWRKRKYPEADYPLAFKTTLYHSKNHPANYQKRILAALSS